MAKDKDYDWKKAPWWDYPEDDDVEIIEIDEEFTDSPLDDLARIINKGKDGGLMVAIQKLALGGNVQKKTAYDPRATTSDMADALRMSGAGSNAQKMQDLQRYNLNTEAPLQKGVMEQMLERPDVAPYTDNYNKPLGSLEEYMSGFEEYKTANPDKLARAGTMAIMPAILPGGYRYDFSGGAEASDFNDYLESIGQLPFRRYDDTTNLSNPFLVQMPQEGGGQDPGYFGNEGIMINGKRYMSEQEAIEDMGIETYNRFMAKGGMAGGKTYHQYHDQYVPRDEESMGYANGGGIGSMMQPKKNYKDQKLTAAQKKKIKPANQGGGPNYLGKEETVTVPKKWLSDPDHVVAELAYITPREQKILLDENLYGSLKGKPNKGPGGVMSLQGDLGGWSSGGGKGGGTTGGGKGGGSNEDYKNTNYYKMMTGQKNIGQTVKTGPKTKKYAVPEYVNVKQPDGTYKNTYVGSGYKSYGQPSFFGNLFSRGAPGYRGIKGMPAFWGKPKFEARQGPDGFGYYSDYEKFGETRDQVPFGIMGIIGSILNKAFPKKNPYEDMSEYNKLGLGGVHPAALDFDPNAKINQTIDTTGTDNSLALSNFYPPNAFNKNEKPKANITGDVDNISIQDYIEGDAGMYEAPPTGIMKPGGYPGDYGSANWDPGMGAAPTGIQYPGGEPNFPQDMMEVDAGMYDGLPNQKLVNDAAMEVFKQGFRNANYEGLPQGSPAMLNPEPITPMMPDPENDLFVDASTNKNQELLENIINQDMYEKNLEPAINNQNKKNNILEQMLLEESTLT